MFLLLETKSELGIPAPKADLDVKLFVVCAKIPKHSRSPSFDPQQRED
jgi:hypothetical protein